MIKQNYKGELMRIVFMMIILGISHCNLSVYNQQSLKITNEALKNIRYSVANFGFAPFGKTIIGKLSLSPHFSDQCQFQHGSQTYQNTFMLIPRGKCQFVFKALNAQSLGVQMAIIMDDAVHDNMLIMADNGYGYKVKIPSIFINYKDGQILKGILEQRPDSSVMMKMIFENNKTDKVDVNFYLQSYNRQSNRLVDNFQRFYPLIKDNIKLNLIYSVVECGRGCKLDDCYYNNKYCAINMIHEESPLANGQLILNQQIREQIIFQLFPDKWWSYMQYVNQNCGTLVELKLCSEKAMKSSGIPVEQVETKFVDSFTSQKDNSYLKKNKQSLNQTGISKYPTVTLNNQRIKGTLNAQFIFDDICNTLLNPPSQCQRFVNSDQFKQKFSNQFPTLILVIVIGVIIFSIIFVIYRRYIKRRISNEMKGRVDDMVSKYVEFYSERSRNK